MAWQTYVQDPSIYTASVPMVVQRRRLGRCYLSLTLNCYNNSYYVPDARVEVAVATFFYGKLYTVLFYPVHYRL